MQVFGKYGVGLSIASLIFFPSLVMMFGKTSSLLSGLILAVLVIYLIILVLISFKPSIAIFSRAKLLQMLFVISMIIIHYYFSGYFFALEQDSIRMFGSIACFIFFFPAAYVAASSLVKIQQSKLRLILGFIFIILLFNAILTSTGVDYFSLQSNKPAFLFSEPSHYALISAPFLMYHVRSRLRGWKLALLIYGLSSVYIENLTMLVVFIFTLIVGFNLRKLFLLLPFLIIIFLIFANVDYFYYRLVYSPNDVNNISLLVFLQGWQNAFLALSNTFGWGVGFQQFGIANPSGELTKKIIEISGTSLNLFDGGTTASKLIGEFGVFGAVLVLVFIYRAIKAYKVLCNGIALTDLFVFSKCVEIAILIELFVRGVGYFSPNLFLYLIVFYVSYLDKQNVVSGNLFNKLIKL
jgi:hypothetical protein